MRDLDFAELQRAPGMRSPFGRLVEGEIAAPINGCIEQLAVPVQQSCEVEDRIAIIRIGLEGALQAIDREFGATLDLEQIGEVVPSLGKMRVGLKGGPVSGFSLDLLAS